MKITEFTQSNMKNLEAQIIEALKDVGERNGVAISFNGGSYSPTEFNPKLSIVAIGDGSIEDAARIKWEENCHYFMLKPTDFGKTILYVGKKYKIVGIAPTRRKYPVVVKNLSNDKEVLITRRYTVID